MVTPLKNILEHLREGLAELCSGQELMQSALRCVAYSGGASPMNRQNLPGCAAQCL